MAWNKTGIATGMGLLAVALLGIGLGRVTVADASDGPGKGNQATAAPTSAPKLTTTTVARPDEDDNRPPAALPAEKPDGPGNDLVIRRPLGSYTREIAPFGKATVTFSENRLRVTAQVHVENVSFTATADADYSVNRESLVYGVITGVDVTTPADGDAAAEIALLAGAANDIPFSFRIRVEDDAILIKDLKVGPYGSPVFAQLMGKGGNEAGELAIMTAAVGGKFKADPNPVSDRPAPVVKPKGRK